MNIIQELKKVVPFNIWNLLYSQVILLVIIRSYTIEIIHDLNIID